MSKRYIVNSSGFVCDTAGYKALEFVMKNEVIADRLNRQEDAIAELERQYAKANATAGRLEIKLHEQYQKVISLKAANRGLDLLNSNLGHEARAYKLMFFIMWFGVAAALAVLLMTGCSYTHPSKATPDLIEKVTNGHVVCYYRDGKRAYAKCCEDCPMHTADSNAITGVK